MKKVLSMVLALALVLTTLVVPMTVSAAGETFTISYKLMNGEVEATDIYPGDEITVEVYANASAAVSAAYELYIPYPANMTLNEEGIVKSGDFVKFVNEVATEIKTAEDDGTKVGEYSFTVPTTGEGSHSIAEISADDTDSYFTVGFNEVAPSAAAKEFTVSAHAAEVQVKYGEMENFEVAENASIATQTATDVYVKVVPTTPTEIDTIKVAKSEDGVYGEATDITNEGKAFDSYGTYKITYVTKDDNKTHEYVITYKSSVVADLVATSTADSVEAGEDFTVNVSVDQLSGNVVEVLTFKVNYDPDVLTLDKTTAQTGVTFGDDDTVTFQAGDSDGIAEDATVVALTFTANASYVGTQSVSITDQALAVDSGFDADASNLDQDITDAVNVTVYSVAAVTAAELGEIDYAQSREIAVSQTADWTVAEGELSVAYMAYADKQTETTAETMYTNGEEIQLSGTVPVTTNEYYYVVARFGSKDNYVYAIIREYEKDALKIDLVGPDVEMTTDFTNWTNEATVDFTVTDAGAGAASLSYKLSAEAEEWSAATFENGDASIELPTASVVTSIIVKAADTLGNESEEKALEVKYDAVVPVIALNVGAYSDAGIPITVTLTPATSGSAEPTSVSVQLKDSEDPATVVDFVDNEATYTAKSNGIYVFTVTDEAGNETVVESETINVGKLSKLKAPTFKISNAETAVAGSLKTDEELTGLGVATNGSFTYLTVIEAADAQGTDYTTTYTLTKDDEEVAGWTPATALEATTGTNLYKLTVKTAMNDNADADYQTATYTFSIADRASFATVNGDSKYRLTDWMIMQLMVGENKNFATDAAANYTGGYFAGDVNADLVNDWQNDSAEMLSQIKSAKTWKTYDFAIYNGLSY